ncbi:MAG: response regulator [Clostridia bacterium]|nr:response regulator [Clostridia bacterium]
MGARFYVVDDDIGVRTILSNIVDDNDLGVIVGASESGEEAVEDIMNLSPDIAFVDLLLPSIDGIEIIKQLRAKGSTTNFIMVSQVNSADMVSEAYQNGIDFYINKPINVIEVVSVTKRALENRKYRQVIEQIGNTLNIAQNSAEAVVQKKPQVREDVIAIFTELGILGDAGCEDLIKMVELVLQDRGPSSQNLHKYNMKDLYLRLSQQHKTENGDVSSSVKAIEQRVRRTLQSALSNVATMGIEDFGNYRFEKYSASIFEFKEVKTEMDHLRGKADARGKISAKLFLEGIINLLR